MDAYSPPSHDSIAASEAPTEPLGPPDANRHRLPDERPAITHHFAVGGHEGYLTVGLYPNGQPGEIFIRMAKEGSTIAGLMECFGTVVSVSLQHGVPLRVLCDKLSHTRFEPSGWTGNERIGYAKSIMDYLFRWIELRFLSGDQLPLFGTLNGRASSSGEGKPSLPPVSAPAQLEHPYVAGDAPACGLWGNDGWCQPYFARARGNANDALPPAHGCHSSRSGHQFPNHPCRGFHDKFG